MLPLRHRRASPSSQISGETSKLAFKSYEQGRRAFEGEAKDFVWCDEEPPMDVYVRDALPFAHD